MDMKTIGIPPCTGTPGQPQKIFEDKSGSFTFVYSLMNPKQLFFPIKFFERIERNNSEAKLFAISFK